MAYRRIEVDPLTPAIGAEIQGVDLSRPLDDQTFDEIHDAWMKHLVIFFRDQDLTLDQHKAFGRRFGALHIHPAAPGPEGHPEIFVVHTDKDSTFSEGNGWHSDVSCDAEPPMGSILRLHTLPATGGDTLFCNTYLVYDNLSASMKTHLDGLTAIHEGEQIFRGRYAEEGVDDSGKNYPRAEHPLIRTHPVTGRKCVYVNQAFTTGIKELRYTEARSVLDYLFEQIERPKYQCRFRWRKHSIAMWDNRCAQHYAMWDYRPHTRSGFRVTVKGDKPQ
ncbi:MAG: TauD/TfdA family dioxygenase [Rhodospirillaceae bacterium]|nr:TauD/TfdA family dioxygenase [Rhodospirillaceae bacterium]